VSTAECDKNDCLSNYSKDLSLCSEGGGNQRKDVRVCICVCGVCDLVCICVYGV